VKDAVLRSFAYNLHFANRLLNDLPTERMCEQPLPRMNHPTWIIGHLADTCDLMAQWLEIETRYCPADWHDLFDNRSEPQKDPAIYPDKSELVKVLELAHKDLATEFLSASELVLQKPLPRESMRQMFPTVLDGVAFEMTDHEAIHLGQLSAWRRAMGMGRA
jgi:hypothetical protein